MGVSVKDLVEAKFDEGIVKQAVDAAGFERKRGRNSLSLDAKGVAKVIKAYTAILAKLTAAVTKFNPDKLDYGTDDDLASKAKAEKKPAPKPKTKAKVETKVIEDDEEEDEFDDEEDDDDEDDEE